jgi:hypothetical protein
VVLFAVWLGLLVLAVVVMHLGPRGSTPALLLGLAVLLYWPIAFPFVLWRERRLEKERAREEDRRIVASAAAAASELVWSSIPSERVDGILRDRDPDFRVERFLAGLERIAEAIASARAAGDPGPARRWMTAALYSRFETEAALLARQGLRTRLVGHVLHDAAIAGAESDERFDTLHARLVLSGEEIDVPLSGASPASGGGSGRRERRVEFWSLLRRRGAATRGESGLVEAECPGCGAPLPPGAAVVRCEHCRLLVNAGTHAWVLAAITREAEWTGVRPPGRVPGFQALARLDPQLCREQLEDRAAFLAMKWIEARCLGRTTGLRRFALPAALARLERDLAGGLGELRLRPGERVAGLASKLQAARAGRPGAPDTAWVRVRWTISRGPDRPRLTPAMQVVLRRDERGGGDEGLAPLRCPACGGDLAATDAPGCEYCGAPVGALPHEWLLADVRDGDAPIDDG